MNRKYELTDETKEVFGKTLHRIRALKAFGDVEARELGGWIEREESLSQEGLCWVSDDGCVSGNGRVYGDAWVYGNGRVFGDAWVCGNGRVFGDAWVFGNGRVFGNGWVYDNGRVYGDGWVYGNGRVSGDAWVCGDGWVSGDTKVCGDMVIQRTRDYLALGPMGPYNEPISFGQDKDRAVVVCCSGFFGTLEEFARKVEETHGDNQFGREYRAAIELAKVRFLMEETK